MFNWFWHPDERDFWETIETYLGAVNAELTMMSGDPGTDRIIENKPDLIVTGAKVPAASRH